MPTEITITRKGSGPVAFEPVSVPDSETVFWRNLDTTEPHWPSYQGQPMTRTQIGESPSTNSDSWPIPANLTPPCTVTYQCSLHAGESGTIEFYANLAPATATLPAGVAGQPYGPQPLTTGGLPPFTWSLASPLPAGLAISPNATALVISGVPTTAGAFSFTLAVTDAAGNNFQQQVYSLTIS